MKTKILVAVLMVMLAGCASTPPAPAVSAQTVEGDPRLPSAEIAELCSPEQWETLRAMNYRAFVVLDTQILTDASVIVGRVPPLP